MSAERGSDTPRRSRTPGDLGRRVAVALVGIPAVLGLLYLGGWALSIPLAVLAGIGAWEFYRLAGARGVRPFVWVGAGAAAAIVLVTTGRPTFSAAAPGILSVIGISCVVALVSALFRRTPEEAPLGAVAATVVGSVYVGLAVAFVPLLHALPEQLSWTAGGGRASAWSGAWVVSLPLAATWIGDSAAYFAGSAWGKAKLFPSVSPKKSWVGAWAGVAGAAAAGLGWRVAVSGTLPDVPLGLVGSVGVGVALGVVAILGDLVESLLKREAGVKDSGSLFPGHGGALDRLDALIATVPLSYVLLVLAERLP